MFCSKAARATSTRFSRSSTTSTRKSGISDSCPWGPSSSRRKGATGYVIEREASPEATTFLPTLEALSDWLERTLAAPGVDPSRTVLAGFSQGAVMAYSLGLPAGRPSPTGILVFSGYLPRVEGFDLDLEGRAGLPGRHGCL